MNWRSCFLARVHTGLSDLDSHPIEDTNQSVDNGNLVRAISCRHLPQILGNNREAPGDKELVHERVEKNNKTCSKCSKGETRQKASSLNRRKRSGRKCSSTSAQCEERNPPMHHKRLVVGWILDGFGLRGSVLFRHTAQFLVARYE